MILKRVSYQNFRNIERTEWEPDEKVSILHGKNAQGKTNLLEGLYFVSQGRSFRTRRDTDLIRLGETTGQISVLYDGNRRTDQTAAVRIFGAGQKSTRICEHNGVRLEKNSELVGKFRSVLFTPTHLELVGGSPEVRRNFLDMALCQLSREYLTALQRFSRILSQRNAHIKALRDLHGIRAPFDETAEILSRALAKEGSAIARMRFEYLKQLSSHISSVFSDMVGGAEKPGLSYRDEGDEKTLWNQLHTHFSEELSRGSTCFGPHRAELILSINGRPMKGIASQGQMRTMALAIKLAEGEVSRQTTGEYPVYLFDDVFSELDSERRSYLLSGRIGGQLIITSCDPMVGAQRFFRVSGGSVIRVFSQDPESALPAPV